MAEPAKKFDIPEKYQYQYKKDYSSDWDIHRNYIQTFDAYEAMLMGTVYDSVTNSIDSSRITDSYATTLAKERADRVIAKLPDGETVPTGKADVGKAAFMDILRQKWLYPNANAQHSLLEKLNMWQLYSSVYGYMPMFYDWNIAPSGYVGPDCWLWSPRNLIPQQGRASINDMEYVTALTWVSKGYLTDVLDDISSGEDDKSERNEKEGSISEQRDDDDPMQPDNEYDDTGWDVDALKLLIGVADQSTNPDTLKDSKVVRDRTPQAQKKGICLATRYEAGEDGEWVTFAPDHGYVEVRRLKNPHKNSRIPFIIKYSQPLFDSFYGLGDFQRAKPLQFARDGLINFYFKGIKMNLIPPIIANANGVLKHTLDYREGAVMLETIPNSIRRLETSTAGLATYQAAQDSLTGSLLSLYGSQNASISAGDALNPSQGKTPQAINLYADKEATRDGSERRHLEDAIMQLTNAWFTLVANIGTEEIPITLFADDIQDIIDAGLSDIKDLFKNFKPNESKTAGDLTIDPTKFKDIELRFRIDPDSTAKANKQAMLATMEQYLTILGKFQNILTVDPGVSIHWDEIMSTYEELGGIPNAHKFMSFDPQLSQQAKIAASQPDPPQAQPPSATSVQMPNGQIHETADLGRLYLNTSDWWIKNQILTALGFQPAPPEVQAQITSSNPDNVDTEGNGPAAPTVIGSGHAFNDPTIAAAADAIHNHPTAPALKPGEALPPASPAATQPEPTVISSGHAFNDATIAKAADAIHKFAPPAPSKPTKP
jgi:hypothetical protein